VLGKPHDQHLRVGASRFFSLLASLLLPSLLALLSTGAGEAVGVGKVEEGAALEAGRPAPVGFAPLLICHERSTDSRNHVKIEHATCTKPESRFPFDFPGLSPLKGSPQVGSNCPLRLQQHVVEVEGARVFPQRLSRGARRGVARQHRVAPIDGTLRRPVASAWRRVGIAAGRIQTR
jgi:hypothetical protein